MKIEDLIIGNVYKSTEYAEVFKCSYMSGMNYSTKTNTLVLISKQNNGCYNDKWDYNTKILHYTGQGKKGNQELTRANKKLLESKSNDTRVYLFEVYKEHEYVYQGEVELVGLPYQVIEEDEDGIERYVWKFPLKKVDGSFSFPISEKQYLEIEKSKNKQIKKLNEHQIKEKALKVDGIVDAKQVITTNRSRNPYVSKYVKNRANGKCDLCGKEAPFKNEDDSPYLESHHVITLSENGPDVVYNAVALCPNCHRKIHVLKDPKDIDQLSKILLKYLLEDDDDVILKKYYELFGGSNE